MRSKSIRLRIFLGMIAGIFGFLFLTGLVMNRVVNRIVDAEVGGTLTRSGDAYRHFARMRDTLFTDRVQSLAQIPHLRAVLGTPDVDQETVAFTVDSLSEASGASELLVADARGALFAGTGRFGGPDFDLANQPGMAAVLSGEPFCGFWNTPSGVFLVAASPVVVGETIQGAVAIGHSIDRAFAAELHGVTGQDVTLLADHRLLAHACETGDHGGEAPLGGPAVWALLESGSRRVTLSGREYLAAAFPLPKSSVTMILSRPLDAAIAPFEKARRDLLWISLAIGLAAFMVSHRMAGRMAIPIQDLTAAAEEVAHGQLDTRVDVPSGVDEIERLAQAFNAMAERIGELVKDVTAKAESARQASETKSVFLATMSHELRTPLNGILGFVEVLESTELTDEQRGHLQIVRQSGEDLSHVIFSILEYANLGSDSALLEQKPFDLRGLLDRVFAEHRKSAASKELSFDVTTSDELPQTVIGDQRRIQEIVDHIVGNAIKFTYTGGVTIDASCGPVEDGQVLLELVVDDTGVGIPVDKLDVLFQPFTQLDGTYHRAFGGTGLGLALTKNLLELMGGRCGVESAKGSGSRFRIEIPLVLPVEVGPALPVVSASESQQTSGTTERILIAEDNPVNHRLLSLIVRRAGWECSVVENGAECLELLEREDFDLVLMDCQMPEVDGFEATRRLRERELGTGRHLPVIAVTANAQEGVRTACFAAGMDGYISKPFKVESLVQEIHRALDERVLS